VQREHHTSDLDGVQFKPAEVSRPNTAASTKIGLIGRVFINDGANTPMILHVGGVESGRPLIFSLTPLMEV
jgi:hypothetical protein